MIRSSVSRDKERCCWWWKESLISVLRSGTDKGPDFKAEIPKR
jgi:hypothetical protein